MNIQRAIEEDVLQGEQWPWKNIKRDALTMLCNVRICSYFYLSICRHGFQFKQHSAEVAISLLHSIAFILWTVFLRWIAFNITFWVWSVNKTTDKLFSWNCPCYCYILNRKIKNLSSTIEKIHNICLKAYTNILFLTKPPNI